MFEPAIINCSTLIDGGFINPLPYDIIRNKCDVLVAIDVSGEKEINNECSKKPSIFESVMYTFNIMEKSILEIKLMKSRPDIYIKPVLKNISLLELNKSRQILQGREAEIEAFRKKLTAALRNNGSGK